jgi:hypothetical protein
MLAWYLTMQRSQFVQNHAMPTSSLTIFGGSARQLKRKTDAIVPTSLSLNYLVGFVFTNGTECRKVVDINADRATI